MPVDVAGGEGQEKSGDIFWRGVLCIYAFGHLVLDQMDSIMMLYDFDNITLSEDSTSPSSPKCKP